MPEIKLAKTAGFCFGVDRAVRLCRTLLDEGRPIATLGPIIHNPQVCEELSARGAAIVEEPEQTEPGTTLVIRSHGVPAEIYRRCRENNIEVADATCPFVAKIHQIVGTGNPEGLDVLIAGDEKHPEVKGILGHCSGRAFVFSDISSFREFFSKNIVNSPCIMVAQTTFNLLQYKEFKRTAEEISADLRIFDTICSATSERQQEAASLSESCDVCIVIGGRRSSNTEKLLGVCAKRCRSYSIERAEELRPEMLAGAEKIGVTAGASTPSVLIEEVLAIMSEMINNNEVQNEEFNFAEALEHSLQQVRRGQHVSGIVTEIRPNEVVVDIGTKHTGFIPADEIVDGSEEIGSVISLGDELKLVVTAVNDQEGIVTLSKKRADAQAGIDIAIAAAENGTVLEGRVTEIVNKGLVAKVSGINVFVPASHATLRRGESYDNLLNTDVKLKILEVNPGRRRAVGSIRLVLAEELAKKRDEIWSSIEVGKTYEGVVKSLTSYGAFVDIGGVDGMVHISELSWKRIRNPQEVVSVGDSLTVYVKDIDQERGRISLGYRKDEDNPWNVLKNNYEIGSTFTAPVVSLTKFGAFVRILPGIDGLVHISEMSEERVEQPSDVVKVGDEVTVRLIGVDYERQRVSLSMKPAAEEE